MPHEVGATGFTGMMAIHPAQVALINAAFTPGHAEIEWANRIVELSDKNPGIGALSLVEKMVDAPISSKQNACSHPAERGLNEASVG
jgi:citrate lyase subunit beta/citryl-CoA lyase